MVAKKRLCIEGARETNNGDLRQGFEKLLRQRVPGKLPRIVMGGSKRGVVDKFLNDNFDGDSFLLVDLDGRRDSRESDLEKLKLNQHSEKVFYMIQEMESWFLSQPVVLDEVFGPLKSGTKISDKIKVKKPEEEQDPKKVLEDMTKDLRKSKKYHVIKHAVELLEKLDAAKLEQDFPDFRRLIECLK
jgi:hypothetical protein